MADKWIQSTFDLLQRLHEDDVVEQLTSGGCPGDVAYKLVAFVVLACGRALMANTGVTFSAMFRATSADGTIGGPQPLSADPYWNPIEAFVADQRKARPEAVRAIGMGSAEFNAVNKAALAGSQLADLVGSDPIFAFIAPDVEPKRSPPVSSGSSLGELRARYRNWDYFGLAAFVLLAPLCVFGLHEFFMWYAESSADRAGDSVYILRPDTNFWYAPASVLGVIGACILVYFLYGLLLQNQVGEYRHYSNLSTGLNARRMYLAFGILLGAMFLAIAFFASHCRLQLTDSEIVFRRMWSLEDEHYPYSEVKALKNIRDRTGETTTFVIEFEHAKEWSTAVEVIFPEQEEKDYLSRRCGKPIETVLSE